MPFIMNHTELAESIAADIESTAQEFFLYPDGTYAGVGIEVNDRCCRSYKAGIDITKSLQEHLNRAAGFIRHVSEKLDDADKRAGISNQLIPDLTWPGDGTLNGTDNLKMFMERYKN